MKPVESEEDKLCAAATSKDPDKIKQLIACSDPGLDTSRALVYAAESGCLESVGLLLPFADAKALGSKALLTASRAGHADCVAALIPVSDPNALESAALRNAIINGRGECVALLLSVSETSGVYVSGRKWTAQGVALEFFQPEIAGMISAYVEAKELSNSLRPAGAPPHARSTL